MAYITPGGAFDGTVSIVYLSCVLLGFILTGFRVEVRKVGFHDMGEVLRFCDSVIAHVQDNIKVARLFTREQYLDLIENTMEAAIDRRCFLGNQVNHQLKIKLHYFAPYITQ